MKAFFKGIVDGLKKTLAMWYMIIIMGGFWTLIGYLTKRGIYNVGLAILSYFTGAALPMNGVFSIGGTIESNNTYRHK